MKKAYIWSLFLLLPLLAGCAGQAKKIAAESALQETTPVLPFAEPEKPAAKLDEDILFHYLVGEIAAQRGKLKLAYNHYLHAALLAGDKYAARRATQIAVFLNDHAGARKAAQRWVSISPNSIQARNTAAVLNYRAGDVDAALADMHALVKIAEAMQKDGFLMLAATLAKEKDHEGILKLMQMFASQYEQDHRAVYALAVLQAAIKKYDPAQQSLDRTLALKPDWPQAMLLRAKIYIEQENNVEATAYLEKALSRHKKNTDLRLLYAKLLAASDEKKSYQQFVVLHRQQPDNNDVIYALGVLAVQLDDLQTARRWWGLLMKQGNRSKRSEAAFHLAQVEEMGGNNKAAISYYKKVSHGHYKVDASLRLARLQAEQGNLDEARDLLQQLRVLQPNRAVDFYLTEAQILRDYLEVEEVLEFYDLALKAVPEDLELLYARGVFAADSGLIEIAERDLRLIIKKQPDHADALNALGYTLADQTTRYNDAYKLIKKAVELKPDNAAILDSMGWVLYRLGDYKQALAYLQKALSLKDDDEIAAHLGEVFWVMGDHERAMQVWNKALKTFPDSSKLQKTMARFK